MSAENRPEQTPRVIDFLPEFVKAIEEALKVGESIWGDTWLHRPRAGQEGRVKQYLDDIFDKNKFAGQPLPWADVAGEALIGFIREKHPELFPK